MKKIFKIVIMLFVLLSFLALPQLGLAEGYTDEEEVKKEEKKKEEGKKEEAKKGKEKKAVEMEEIVVTATRTPEKKADLPQVVNIISQKDIENTVDTFDSIIDVLKKNSSVDVQEFPNTVGRIGMRGFTPDSGPNAHTLFLVDGLPVGGRMMDFTMDNIERIEVVKGPASALYGSGAMGGVVNAITKKSRGKIKTALTVGGGSFDAWNAKVSTGGNITDRFDFDLNASTNHQNDDFRMGNGDKWEPSTFKKYYGAIRIGAAFTENWRMDIKGDWFSGRDLGENASLWKGEGINCISDLDRYGGDMRLSGLIGQNNEISLAFYTSRDKYERHEVHRGKEPYLEAIMTNEWIGGQLQDTYYLGKHNFTLGCDYRLVESEWKYWKSAGVRKTPWSPISEEESLGLFGEAMMKSFNERLIATLGGRYDTIEVKTKETPYMTGLTPGAADFSTFNPSGGLKFFITPEWQAHTTIGQAFVAPQARQMSGRYEWIKQGKSFFTYGNKDLSPEKSVTWDGGIIFAKKEWGLFADLTYFMTDVDNKIGQVTVSATESTYENTQEAEMRGLEGEFSLDIGKLVNWGSSLRLFSNFTKLFKAEETISTGKRDIYNVANIKIIYGFEYDDGHFFDGRISGRYVGHRKYKDWSAAGHPEARLPPFNVVDLVANFQFVKDHRLSLQIGNLFDKYYGEYQYSQLPGRNFSATYTIKF